MTLSVIPWSLLTRDKGGTLDIVCPNVTKMLFDVEFGRIFLPTLLVYSRVS